LVFPDSHDLPTEASELPVVFLVAFSITGNLVAPEVWQFVAPDLEAPPMPEVTVDENGNSFLREDEIGTAREGAIMLPEFDPRGLQKGADISFRGCILPLNSRHHSTSLLRRYDVDHGRSPLASG
jgi:hypothetical protein